MTWNHDITAAPRGKTVTVTRTVKGEDRQFEEHHIAPLWIATKDGKVHRSYWIPAMKNTDGRWSGFSAGSDEPIAWQEYVVPVHPFTAAPDEAAVTSGNDLRKPVAAEQGQIIREGDAPRETDRASGDASGLDTNSPAVAHETRGGAGDDCSVGKRGAWPPQGGASSSHGNDSLSVVTAGETASHFIDDCGSGA